MRRLARHQFPIPAGRCPHKLQAQALMWLAPMGPPPGRFEPFHAVQSLTKRMDSQPAWEFPSRVQTASGADARGKSCRRSKQAAQPGTGPGADRYNAMQGHACWTRCWAVRHLFTGLFVGCKQPGQAFGHADLQWVHQFHSEWPLRPCCKAPRMEIGRSAAWSAVWDCQGRSIAKR